MDCYVRAYSVIELAGSRNIEFNEASDANNQFIF